MQLQGIPFFLEGRRCGALAAPFPTEEMLF